MIFQVLDRYDVLFITVAVLSTYCYVAVSFRGNKPKTEFTIAPRTLLTLLLSCSAFVVSLAGVLLAGVLGYFGVAILLPPLIHKIVKKMTADEVAGMQ